MCSPCGDPKKGNCVKASQKAETSQERAPGLTLLTLRTQQVSLLQDGTHHLVQFLRRNASYEVQKAWTISVMGTAMTGTVLLRLQRVLQSV